MSCIAPKSAHCHKCFLYVILSTGVIHKNLATYRFPADSLLAYRLTAHIFTKLTAGVDYKAEFCKADCLRAPYRAHTSNTTTVG